MATSGEQARLERDAIGLPEVLFQSYVRNGLRSCFGWLVAWSFALAEPLVMPLLLGGFGFYGAGYGRSGSWTRAHLPSCDHRRRLCARGATLGASHGRAAGVLV